MRFIKANDGYIRIDTISAFYQDKAIKSMNKFAAELNKEDSQ